MTAPADPESKFARDAWIRALQRSASIDEHPERTLPLLIDGLAQEFGPAPALESRAGSLTYAALAARSHQYARWGRSRGLASGDVAALLMPNCAEYVAIWLGLTRIGVTVALLNTHLGSEALGHCIDIASPRLLIAGADFASTLVSLRPRLKPELERWVLGAGAPGVDAQDPALDLA